MDALQVLLDHLWLDYEALNPQVRQIHGLLTDAGETIVNDHIALRTFDDPRCDLDALSRPFLEAGYRPAGRYRFEQKRLVAWHLEPPDPALPLVFVSQLVLRELSPGLRAIVAGLLDQLPEALPGSGALAAAGRPWQVAHADVARLAEESEYAAWMAAHGFRANHFTVLVNALARYGDLPRLCAFLEEHGLAMSRAGGLIKGSPAEGLEQASTLASQVAVAFSDGTFTVPGCYYELARRHERDGKLFRGFIEGSADRIFESTDRPPPSGSDLEADVAQADALRRSEAAAGATDGDVYEGGPAGGSQDPPARP
jgi:hypothetical protein